MSFFTFAPCPLLFAVILVARDGIEPPPPAFADPQQQALSTTYKSRETAEVLGNTRKLRQLLTRTADRSQAAFPLRRR